MNTQSTGHNPLAQGDLFQAAIEGEQRIASEPLIDDQSRFYSDSGDVLRHNQGVGIEDA